MIPLSLLIDPSLMPPAAAAPALSPFLFLPLIGMYLPIKKGYMCGGKKREGEKEKKKKKKKDRVPSIRLLLDPFPHILLDPCIPFDVLSTKGCV